MIDWKPDETKNCEKCINHMFDESNDIIDCKITHAGISIADDLMALVWIIEVVNRNIDNPFMKEKYLRVLAILCPLYDIKQGVRLCFN
jgi:hypothetical protein